MAPATITDHKGVVEVKMSVVEWELFGPVCVRPLIVEYPEPGKPNKRK